MREELNDTMEVYQVEKVEVVRCQNCRNWMPMTEMEHAGVCKYHRNTPMLARDFCSYGRKKND